MVDKNDGKSYANYIRGLRSTEALMRQFLKLETGLGNNPAFIRGHTWTFEWCSEDPAKARPEKVAEVRKLMDEGMTFEEAFDAVAGRG